MALLDIGPRKLDERRPYRFAFSRHHPQHPPLQYTTRTLIVSVDYTHTYTIYGPIYFNEVLAMLMRLSD